MPDTALAASRYLSLTTFTRDGRPKPTPVWIAELDGGRLGFTTSASSWKVRRIRATPEVTLAPCDSRGRVAADVQPVRATAEVHTGAVFDEVRAAVARKYGLQFRLIALWGRLSGLLGRDAGTDCAVVVVPELPSGRGDSSG